MGFRMVKIGSWEQAIHILDDLDSKFEKVAQQAISAEADFLVGEIKKGIQSQAPAGQTFEPLAETTIATRKAKRFKGTKALIRGGDLLASVTKVKADGGWFVGVPRTAQLVNIAKIHEEGGAPIVMKLTPKARRFLFAAYKKAGIFDPDKAKSKTSGGISIIVIKRVARPFLAPVFEKEYANDAIVGMRILQRIAAKIPGLSLA